MTQPEAPYRDGGAAHGGLPLPRAGMGVAGGLVIALAVLATFMPIGSLGSSPGAIWQTIKYGGLVMFALLLAMIAVPLVVGVLGMFAVRGRAVPPFALFGPALLPLFAGIGGTLWTHAKIAGIFEGESIDASQKIRIAFEGMSEEEAALQFGAVISAYSLGVAAIACACIVATIDRRRTNTPGTPGWIIALAFPVIALLASVASSIATRGFRYAPGTIAIGSLSLMFVAIVAPLAARVTPALRTWHDPAEARKMLSALVIAAAAGALALFLLDRAAILSEQRLAFGACSGESVDPSQRARILMEWKEMAAAMRTVTVIQSVGAFVAFLPAIFGGMRGAVHPFAAPGPIALVVAIVFAGAYVGVDLRARGLITKTATSSRAQPYPVSLPHASSSKNLRPVYGDVVVIDRDGKVIGTPISDRELLDAIQPARAIATDADANAVKILSSFASGQGKRYAPEVSLQLLVIAPPDVSEGPFEIDPEVKTMLGADIPAVHFRSLLAPPSYTGANTITILAGSVQLHQRGRSDIGFVLPGGESQLVSALATLGRTDVDVLVDDTTKIGTLVTVLSAIDANGDAHVRLAR